MKDKLKTDTDLYRMADSMLAALQEAEQAFEAMLAEEAKISLGIVPYNDPGWEQRRSTESLCDGLLADPSGKSSAFFLALLHFHSCVAELDRMITKSGLTRAERTVAVMWCINNIKDNQIINEIDGYDNAEMILEAAATKLSRMMDDGE